LGDIEAKFTISPSIGNDEKTVFEPMRLIESYDQDDLDESGNPRDISYERALDTAGVFPVLKLGKDNVPVGDISAYCIHFAWR